MTATAPTPFLEVLGCLWLAIEGSTPSPLLAAVRGAVARAEVVGA